MKKKFFNEKKIAIFKKSAKNENFSEFFRFFQNFQDFSKILNLILMFEVRNSD